MSNVRDVLDYTRGLPIGRTPLEGAPKRKSGRNNRWGSGQSGWYDHETSLRGLGRATARATQVTRTKGSQTTGPTKTHVPKPAAPPAPLKPAPRQYDVGSRNPAHGKGPGPGSWNNGRGSWSTGPRRQ